MDGLDPIVVKISTIAWMQLALMVLLVLMELEASIVVVPLEKRGFYAIWTTLAHQILAMRTQFVTPVQSTDRLLAPVHKDTKE